MFNFVIFYKIYEGNDKVMNIHTPILDGSASVLQLEG